MATNLFKWKFETSFRKKEIERKRERKREKKRMHFSWTKCDKLVFVKMDLRRERERERERERKKFLTQHLGSRFLVSKIGRKKN